MFQKNKKTDTMNLVDAIVESGLKPRGYSGRGMYGEECVACVVHSMQEADGLPLARARSDGLGLNTILYWPHAVWDESVERYVSIVTDPSGDSYYSGNE